MSIGTKSDIVNPARRFKCRDESPGFCIPDSYFVIRRRRRNVGSKRTNRNSVNLPGVAFHDRRYFATWDLAEFYSVFEARYGVLAVRCERDRSVAVHS